MDTLGAETSRAVLMQVRFSPRDARIITSGDGMARASPKLTRESGRRSFDFPSESTLEEGI
jgi:hypothetical protein